MMDRRRMDAEGGRVVHRDRRAGKLAVVVAVQNVLVIACLLVALYFYWDLQERYRHSDEDIHIHFAAIADIEGNNVLKFNRIYSNNSIDLADENKTIDIKCKGPYILYMDVCYQSKDKVKEANGTLQLQVEGQQSPLWTFNMRDSKDVCKGLHAIVYLRAKERATLHLQSTEYFKIKNVSVSLNYMLGRRCEF